MTKAASQLLEEALQLEPNDRARLAAELLRRAADAESDPDDEEDWRTALDEVRREVLSR